MSDTMVANVPMMRATNLKTARQSVEHGNVWDLANLTGRLIEISEDRTSGATSFVAGLIRKAQLGAQTVIWVSSSNSIFYPPDMEAQQIDLERLPVVRISGLKDCLFVLEVLVKSGAFTLIIADVGQQNYINDASLGRLLTLSDRSNCALIFLTKKSSDDASIGSMISLRAEVTQLGLFPFSSQIRVTKNKRWAPGSKELVTHDAPRGMH